MAYVKGGLIEATDYNQLRASTDAVYGNGTGTAGYGQTAIALPAVAVGDLIRSQEWTNMRNAIAVCSIHQSDSVPAILPTANSDLAVGALVVAHSNNDPVPPGVPAVHQFSPVLDTITANSQLAHWSSLAISNVRTNSRAGWTSNQTIHTFDVNFGSSDKARHFFNSGGELKISTSRTGGSGHGEDLMWTKFLRDDVGVISMRRSDSRKDDGTWASGTGYYDLGTSYKTIFSNSTSESGTTIGWTSWDRRYRHFWRHPVNRTDPDMSTWGSMWIYWDNDKIYEGTGAPGLQTAAGLRQTYEIEVGGNVYQRRPGGESDPNYDPNNPNNDATVRAAQDVVYNSRPTDGDGSTPPPGITWEENGIDCRLDSEGNRPRPCWNGWWQLRKGTTVNYNRSAAITISAKRVGATGGNGGNGATVQFRVTMTNTGANLPTGTTSMRFDVSKAVNPLSIDTPDATSGSWT